MMTPRPSPLPAARTGLLTLLAVLIPVLGACGGTSPPTAPDAEVVEPPLDGDLPPDPNARTGTFTGLSGYAAAGTVRVRLIADTAVIEFHSDFRSQQVPGPYVYLNTDIDANRGRPIRISALESPTGTQAYAAVVPIDVTYEYVLVWCDPFNVGVAAARLSP